MLAQVLSCPCQGGSHDDHVPRALTYLAVVTGCCLGWACQQPVEGAAAAEQADLPRRVVAGSIFAAEVLVELAPPGLLVGVHELVADPAFCAVAGKLANLPKVGASPEQLLAVRPDLVVLDAYTRPETLALLRAASIPVLQLAAPRSFADIAANIRSLARTCGLQAPGEVLVAQMQDRLRQLEAAQAGLQSWAVCSLDGAYHTYGAGSLFDAVLQAVGVRNLAAERGAGMFRKLSLESLLAWRPDALVVAAETAAAGRPAWLDQVPGLALLACYQRERFVVLPGALLGSTSHHLVEVAATIQQHLLAWGRP